MTSVAPLTDFPDRLSPMVVKELRQGLRTKLFGGTLLVLHGLLVLITLLTGAGPDAAEARGLMDGLISLVLFVIFPLCGFSALAGEIKANTMDMLVLTRLSAGRIVLGKWAAIVFQSLLVTVSIIPYFVARYVFGGSELFTDLYMLFSQWLSGAVLTAGVVALSTQKQFWLRAIILAVPLFLSGLSSITWAAMGVVGRMSTSGGTSMSSAGLPNGWVIVGWLAGTAWLIFALLGFGATKIAPAASLLPVTKRLVNLAALIVLPLLTWLTVGKEVVIPPIMLVLLVASVDALTDDLRNLPSIYLPFYRRSRWGRLASWFFAPGWMHGFLYSLLLFFLSIVAIWQIFSGEEAMRVWLAGCCIWLSALFGQVLAIQRREGYLGALFAGVCLTALFSGLVTLLQVSNRKSELEWLSCLLPVNAMWASEIPPSGGWSLLQIGCMVNVMWPMLLAVLARLAFLRTRFARREARLLAQS